jgi:tetraacyldisaccharide 4'-kinase
MKFLRIILFPISILYGWIVFLRNKLFDWKIIPSKSFDIPIISVGNLSAGGTGKTPHIEYLIRLLKPEFYQIRNQQLLILAMSHYNSKKSSVIFV